MSFWLERRERARLNLHELVAAHQIDLAPVDVDFGAIARSRVVRFECRVQGTFVEGANAHHNVLSRIVDEGQLKTRRRTAKRFGKRIVGVVYSDKSAPPAMTTGLPVARSSDGERCGRMTLPRRCTVTG